MAGGALAMRPAAAFALACVAAVLLVVAHRSGGGVVELYFAPHPPATAPHQSVDQAWADLAAHAPAAPSWLAAAEAKQTAEARQPAGMAVVDAEHRVDPNFPVELPSAARAEAVQHQQQEVVEQQQVEQHLRAKARQPASYASSNSEWQSLRNKMYKAVHVFHKYGDLALEKLIPHPQPAASIHQQDKHQIHRQAQAKVETLRAAQEQPPQENHGGESKLELMEENIKLQEKMKRAALKAKEDAKIAAANAKAKQLAKELKKSQAQDKRELKHIQEEVKGLAQENEKLRSKDAKVSSELKHVAEEDKSKGASRLASLNRKLAKVRQSETSDVSALRQRLAGMKQQNAALRAAVAKNKQEVAATKQQQRKQRKQLHAMRGEEQHRLVVDEEGDDIRRDDARAMMQDHPPPAPSPLVHLPPAAAPAVRRQRPSTLHRLLHPHPHPARAGAEGESSRAYNQHLPEAGFAFTDASLGCISCITGPDCHAGCRIVPGKPDGITMAEVAMRRRQQRLRQLTHAIAPGHMLKGEEGEGEEASAGCAEEDGGCSTLTEDGVNVDGWGDDVGAMAAAASEDPGVNVRARREMNQRQGRFAAYDHSKDEGVYTPPSSWGAAARFFGHDNSPGAQKLEERKVRVDGWPSDIYSSMPIPMFDKSVWDHKKNQGFVMQDALKFNRESNAHMEKAGVLVNKWPQEEFEGEREMPTVDGVADHYVENQQVPEYRDQGQAAQEKPLYFLLRDHVNLAAAQPHLDAKKGVETFDEKSMEGHHPGEPGWRTIHDSLGCGPQGCFDK